MIIKLHTSQKVTAGLRSGREWERKRERRDKGKGGGEGRARWRERTEKERQKDEDESVGEMMGIKRETGAGQSWTKLNIAECIIGDKWTPDRSEMSAAEGRAGH